jgi:hypothetical protein
MKARHPKVLKVKPPRDFGSPPEAFLFGEALRWLKKEPGVN